MRSIAASVRAGGVVFGTWIVMDSPVAAEIAGAAGFDWVVLDAEHGMMGTDRLLGQLQALAGTPAVPLVRVAANDPALIKRVLDLGAAGIVVPQVGSCEEAGRAVRAMRYPPEGVRGVTALSRPAGYGVRFSEYVAAANHELLCVVQIESREGLAQAEEIAATDGVDVLFVGPLDLSASLGILGQLSHPAFRDAVARVVAAAKGAGKAAGILLAAPDQVDEAVAGGFTFIGVGADAGALATAMARMTAPFAHHRDPT